jgi:hypothetical protein
MVTCFDLIYPYGAISVSRYIVCLCFCTSEWICCQNIVFSFLSDVSGEALGARWHQQLAIFIANRSRIKDSFLVHFGDQLWQENLIVAAHLTYLLANIEMDPADAQNRVILLTADTFRNPLHYWKDVNAFQLTEIYEGIRRKSNSQFSMPYLVMYKMIYAGLACEYGFTERSKR